MAKFNPLQNLAGKLTEAPAPAPIELKVATTFDEISMRIRAWRRAHAAYTDAATKVRTAELVRDVANKEMLATTSALHGAAPGLYDVDGRVTEISSKGSWGGPDDPRRYVADREVVRG